MKRENRGYTVNILESSKELSLRERVMFKDTSDAISIDANINGEDDNVIITPTGWVLLGIHNEKGQNPDYDVLVLYEEGDAGVVKYTTGSPSFIQNFFDIAGEMGDEEYTIKCYKRPSKNYSGKMFLTCSIV